MLSALTFSPLFSSFFQKQLDKAEAYQKAMRKRSMRVEPLFGQAKEFHRFRQFRLRRLLNENIEGVMVAAARNLRRLIKRRLTVLFFGCRAWIWTTQFPSEP